ncbi:MAG TPA: AAA family ATPase [Allosphingosinicella sp.]|nr:AAA family ATPase [Allosphingosinicella sp.]
MTRPPSSLYNQTRLDDDDFVANFVARHDVLDALIRRLRGTGKDDRGLHHMLVGARGMGKTSLLRRVAIAVNRDETLGARYVPLSFREEQYNVLSLGDFWRNCGEALAEWADSNGRADLAERLDRAIDRGEWKDDETAAERFAQELKALGRRAILLVDNLDLILAALGQEDQWILRRYLQAPDGPVMIGAATQSLKESADHNAAFYEFLQPHYLEPLDERETESCMRALADRRGEHGRQVVEVLDRQPERLRTLHTLTGGNPRVLALIYRLLESAETDAAMADLELLLDQVTPYYKARIEEYQTPTQRAVIDAIALNWDPITVGGLSDATNVVTTTLSPMLQKLRRDGLIEQVEGSGAYARHQIVERFLNIWYLMRHGTRRTRQKMRWLVEYLASFYAPNELAELAQRYRHSWCGDYAIAADEAIARQSSVTERELTLSTADASDDEAVSAAFDLNDKAARRYRAGDSRHSLTLLDDLIARFGEATELALRQQVAWAMLFKGAVCGERDDWDEAFANYDEVIARYGQDLDPTLQMQVRTALLNKGVRLSEIGDHAEAIALWNQLIELASDGQRGQRLEVARALYNKGFVMGADGDDGGAIATYDELIAEFGESLEPALSEQVANALFGKGVKLGASGDNAGAITTYDELIARFGEAAPTLRESVAKALFAKGSTLDAMCEWDAGIIEMEKSLAVFSELDKERVAPLWAIAARGLGNRLIDRREDYGRAEPLLADAMEDISEATRLSLAWLYLLDGRPIETARVRPELENVQSVQLALLDAGLALASDDFEVATGHLAAALGDDPTAAASEHARDFERLLRLAERRGHGERLIAWFEESGLADRLAPVHAAFVAYVRGERTLLDVNPEVRRPAQILYDRLDAPRQYRRAQAPPPGPTKRGRGRPRKAGADRATRQSKAPR